MSRVLLADIQRLTLSKGAKTKGRRLPSIPQLKCIGESCKSFEPEVVRCHNVGGEGTEIDWTCEADLPETLRFGRVDVSCEGWTKPGDPYVVKGSCGLTYRLVRMSELGEPKSSRFNLDNIMSTFFAVLSSGIILYILYAILRGCWNQNQNNTSSNGPRPNNRPTHRGGGGGGGGNDSPPPYSSFDRKQDNTQPPTSSDSSFVRGAVAGAVGGAAALAVQAVGRGLYNPEYPSQSYDWERRDRPTSTTTTRHRNSDRGEGSSDLGELRASTGYGTSSVR